jgi:hypothetical protein
MDTNEVIDMYFNMNMCRLCTRERNALRPLFDGNEDLTAKIKVLSPCTQVSLKLIIKCRYTIYASRSALGEVLCMEQIRNVKEWKNPKVT